MGARLIAEIGADTSGFEAGLRRADGMAGSYGKKISSKLGAAFGAGFLISAIAHLPGKLAEQAEQITEGASKLKVTTDEYQMLSAAAKDAGQGVEEFVNANAKNGVMLDTLIKRMADYRGQIKMSKGEISEWLQLKQYGQSFTEGAAKPLNWMLQFFGRTFAEGSDILGAVGGTLLNGLTFGKAGAKPEDFISNFMQRWGLSEKDTGSKALPLPAGYGQQAKFDRLKRNLGILESEESDLKAQGRTRASIWNSAGTDWQQAGAYVRREGMIVEETSRTNEKLEEVRKEITQVREEIRKLNGGGA